MATPRLRMRDEPTVATQRTIGGPATKRPDTQKGCDERHKALVWGMRISEVLRRKGTAVVTIRPDATVRDLIRVLHEHGIGALVVSEDEGQSLVGIISERDVVRELNAMGAGVLDQPVSALMTTDVHTCVPEDELEDLARVMTDRRVRHLPVVVDGRLEAVVSIGDIVKHRIDELQAERDQLVDYVHASYRSSS